MSNDDNLLGIFDSSPMDDNLLGRSVSFVIPQTPKGKMRHQTVVMLRCGQCQRHVMGQRKECPTCLSKQLYFVRSDEYTPKDQKEYEKFAANCALQGLHGQDKFAGPTKVECYFYFCIPKTRTGKLHNRDWHTQRPDTDNCVKSIWDALNQVCFSDDCTVVQMYAEKRWTSGIPRTEVTISSL